MNATVEAIDSGKATLAEIRRMGLDALVKALGPVGMSRFLQQLDSGHSDYVAERCAILGNPTVDQLMDEIDRRGGNALPE